MYAKSTCASIRFNSDTVEIPYKKTERTMCSLFLLQEFRYEQSSNLYGMLSCKVNATDICLHGILLFYHDVAFLCTKTI